MQHRSRERGVSTRREQESRRKDNREQESGRKDSSEQWSKGECRDMKKPAGVTGAPLAGTSIPRGGQGGAGPAR